MVLEEFLDIPAGGMGMLGSPGAIGAGGFVGAFGGIGASAGGGEFWNSVGGGGATG